MLCTSLKQHSTTTTTTNTKFPRRHFLPTTQRHYSPHFSEAWICMPRCFWLRMPISFLARTHQHQKRNELIFLASNSSEPKWRWSLVLPPAPSTIISIACFYYSLSAHWYQQILTNWTALLIHLGERLNDKII
jgi:hypothetical protein